VLGEELLHAGNDALTRLRRQEGFIFQAHNLLPYPKALENVRFGLEVTPTWLSRGWTAMEACAATMLGHGGLAERLDSFPEKLSGGQK